MRNLWFLMLLGACVDEDVARVEQRLTETYDVCAKDGCTPCWIEPADKNRELCEKPVDVAGHRGLAKTDLVFENDKHEVALWSAKDGWRVLSPTYASGDALAAADFDGDGLLELPVGVGGYWTIARDPASGQATGKRGHGPIRGEPQATRRNTYWRMLGMDLQGRGHKDMVWVGELGEVDVAFVVEAKVESVDPTRELPGWAMLGVGDFDGSKTDDMLWRAGEKVRIRSMAGSKITAERAESVDATWAFVGAADVDKDARADILWRDTKGAVIVWSSGSSKKAFTQKLDPKLGVEALHDLDGDGVADLLVRDGTKSVVYKLVDKAWKPTNLGFTHDDTWTAQT